MYILCPFPHHCLLLPPSLSPFHSKSFLPPLQPLQFPPRPLLLSFFSFTIFPFFILYHSSSVSFSLSSFSSFLRFFSLSALLRYLDKNTPAYCSENRSLFALTRTYFAAYSSFSFTSTDLILYSSLFPSLINCFCSTFSISIASNIFLQATSSSLYICNYILLYIYVITYTYSNISLVLHNPQMLMYRIFNIYPNRKLSSDYHSLY